MGDARFLADEDSCPKCGAIWTVYAMGESGRERRGSNIIGIVENDRVTRWRCPACETEWPRGHVLNGRVGSLDRNETTE